VKSKAGGRNLETAPNLMSIATTECINELNPLGGFASNHHRLCAQCDEDAVNHVRVVDVRWCANLCERCSKHMAAKHRAVVEKGLRGINSEEGSDV